MLDELTIKKFKFWDLWVQKHLRNFASFKLLLFLLILLPSVYLVYNKFITGSNFALIITSGAAVVATGRVYEKVSLMQESREVVADSEYPEMMGHFPNRRTINKKIKDRYTDDGDI